MIQFYSDFPWKLQHYENIDTPLKRVKLTILTTSRQASG